MTIQDSCVEEDTTNDTQESKAPLTIVVEGRSSSPIPEDSAFVTPNGPSKLQSPANEADLLDFIDPYRFSPLDLSLSSRELPMAKSAEERLSDDVELEDRDLGYQQDDYNDTELAMQNAYEVDSDTSCNSTGNTVPVYPKLCYDIELMSYNPGEIGRGGFGRVCEKMYKDETGEVHLVAVKYPTNYSQDAKQTLKSELELVCKVPLHSNVVRYFGGSISQDDNDDDNTSNSQTNFIVMELLHTNLEHLIHGDEFKNRLSCKLLLSITLDIVTGLQHLHEHGIIHYDLKPSNVLLDEDLHAKLADFGCSKKKLKNKITASLRGTLGYIAPEVLILNYVGHAQVDEKLDIYSLGIVMREMATGEYPPELQDFTASSQAFSSFSTQSTCPVFDRETVTSNLHDSHSAIDALIQACTSLEPNNRPTTQELKASLLAIREKYF
eukprot:g4955.t1